MSLTPKTPKEYLVYISAVVNNHYCLLICQFKTESYFREPFHILLLDTILYHAPYSSRINNNLALALTGYDRNGSGVFAVESIIKMKLIV
jgi:hypothetical protein